VFFTGSDWCVWCRRLEEGLYRDDAVVQALGEKWVTVKIDEPRRRRQPMALQRQRKRLAERFEIRAVPTVLLLDPKTESILFQHAHLDVTPEVYRVDVLHALAEGAEPPAESGEHP